MTRLAKSLAIELKRHLAGAKPSVSEAGVLLWNLFMEISASRTYHAAGPNPISFSEISEYAQLHRWPLQLHHVAVIRALDDAWLEHAYRDRESSKRKETQTVAQRAHARPLSAAAFDAVFG